jgi:GntR family transcriptional regulator
VLLRVDPHSDVPPSRQIVEAVLDRVARGDVVPGDRLPSVRALAEGALVNPNTVGRAYRDLEGLGVVEGRNGSGVFVRDGGPAVARAQRRRSTLEAFRRAARQALRAGHAPDALDAALAALSREAARAAAGGEEA